MMAGSEIMNKYYAAVYEIVARIPAGKVASYGQIAAMLGNPLAARQVGYAMNAAPEHMNLPCHRVVSKEGRMLPGAVFGDFGMQRKTLEQEGVVFLENGCIDMKKSLWRPEVSI